MHDKCSKQNSPVCVNCPTFLNSQRVKQQEAMQRLAKESRPTVPRVSGSYTGYPVETQEEFRFDTHRVVKTNFPGNQT